MAETIINKVRPRLNKVAPLTSYICWCFVVANIFLGLGMIFLYSTPVPIAVANIFPYPVWGALFLLAAVVCAYGLIRNNWQIVRQVQVLGLAVKITWAIALIVRCFSAPGTILITVVWLFLAAIQAGVYIHFIPMRLRDVR